MAPKRDRTGQVRDRKVERAKGKAKAKAAVANQLAHAVFIAADVEARLAARTLREAEAAQVRTPLFISLAQPFPSSAVVSRLSVA